MSKPETVADVMESGAFEIESGIPIPPALRGRASMYPFDRMQPGDSFVVPFRPGKKAGHDCSRVGTMSRAWAKRTGKPWTFVVRATSRGVRIWRTK